MTDPRKSLQMAAGTSLIASFLTAKVIAIISGPTGVGFQGAILSGGSLAALLATWAAANTLPQLAAQRPNAGGWDFASTVAKGSVAALPPAMAFTWLLVVPELVRAFPAPIVMLGMGSGTTASLLSATVPTFLTVFGNAAAAARYQLTAAVAGSVATVLSVLLLPSGGLPVAVGGGLLIGQLGALAGSSRVLRLWRAYERIPVRWFIAESSAVFVSTVLSAAALSVVPLISLKWAGPETTGLLRAANSLGAIPSAVLITSLSLHFYPQVASLRSMGEGTRGVTAESLRSIGRRAAWPSLLIGLTAPVTLWLAYSRDFLQASAALAFLLAAGLVRVLSLHNAYLLLASQRRLAYLSAEGVSAALLLVLVRGAASAGSATLLGATAWASYMAHFAITTILLRGTTDGGARIRSQPAVALVAQVALPALGLLWWYAAKSGWLFEIGG